MTREDEMENRSDLSRVEGERKKSSEYSYSLSNFEAQQICTLVSESKVPPDVVAPKPLRYTANFFGHEHKGQK